MIGLCCFFVSVITFRCSKNSSTFNFESGKLVFGRKLDGSLRVLSKEKMFSTFQNNREIQIEIVKKNGNFHGKQFYFVVVIQK